MIRYYICNFCNHNFQKEQSLHDPILKKCPQCCKEALFQDLTGVYVKDGAFHTVGSLLDSQKPTSYELQEKVRKDKTLRRKQKENALRKRGMLKDNESLPKGKRPWYGSLDKEKSEQILSGSEKEQKEKAKKYILEGK